MPTRLAIAGVAGRMGREVVGAAAADPQFAIVGGTVRLGRAQGRDFAQASGMPVAGARLSEDLRDLTGDVDVIVDFTTPESSIAHSAVAAESGRAIVIGTTGLSDAQLELIRASARRCPILYGRNMSVGINALVRLLPAITRALEGYDIEITEAHHRYKRDAPSGTALALGEAIAAARGTDLASCARHGRSGIRAREPQEIGFHALRAGGNAGEHTVLFADDGEQVEIVHRAYSRRTFALGALRAARWLVSRPPGFYGMADIL